jgi:hypothetical protein
MFKHNKTNSPPKDRNMDFTRTYEEQEKMKQLSLANYPNKQNTSKLNDEEDEDYEGGIEEQKSEESFK